MSVEYSSTIGYGFEISQEGLELIEGRAGAIGENVEEFLYAELQPSLIVVTAGSYYDNEPFKYAISVRSRTTEYGRHEGPTEIVPLEIPLLSLQEAQDLNKALTEHKSEGQRVSYFYAGLWH